MTQDNSSQATLTELNLINRPVATRTTSWLDLAMRAWGSEFHAPDRDVYNFSQGRHFDSTDKGLTGIYGVEVWPSFEGDNQWPDADFNLAVSDPDVTNLLQFDSVAPAADAAQFMTTESDQILVQENGYGIVI